MEIISEKEVSNKQAIHFLKKSAKDSYIEENDPELAKNLNLVLTELQAHSSEIIVNNKPQVEEKDNKEENSPEEQPKSEEKPEEAAKEEEKPAEEKHRHRKHRSHKKTEEE